MRRSDPDDTKFTALENYALSSLSMHTSNAVAERLYSTATFIENRLQPNVFQDV